jgi:tripartite-type tricarboxylate transporter receptor subunit TctC
MGAMGIMKLSSVRFCIVILVIFSCLIATTHFVEAQQQYPVRPIRLIIPASPGGGQDITARSILPRLSEKLGQPVIIDYRTGGGTMIGTEAGARAKPDGYTLVITTSALAIDPAMYKKVPYDAIKDLAPISLIVSLPNVLVVNPEIPAQTVKEFISYSRSRPGDINFASSGIGTNWHLSMELFLNMTGLSMVHVPYKAGAPAITDVMGGTVSTCTASIMTVLPYITSGRLRALGVTSRRRSAAAPEIPTIDESGVPGYESIHWFGLLAPAGTPREIISKVHGAVVYALKDPDVRKILINTGADPVGNSPEEFSAFIMSETDKWAKLVRAIGIEKR